MLLLPPVPCNRSASVIRQAGRQARRSEIPGSTAPGARCAARFTDGVTESQCNPVENGNNVSPEPPGSTACGAGSCDGPGRAVCIIGSEEGDRSQRACVLLNVAACSAPHPTLRSQTWKVCLLGPSVLWGHEILPLIGQRAPSGWCCGGPGSTVTSNKGIPVWIWLFCFLHRRKPQQRAQVCGLHTGGLAGGLFLSSL